MVLISMALYKKEYKYLLYLLNGTIHSHLELQGINKHYSIVKLNNKSNTPI